MGSAAAATQCKKVASDHEVDSSLEEYGTDNTPSYLVSQVPAETKTVGSRLVYQVWFDSHIMKGRTVVQG